MFFSEKEIHAMASGHYFGLGNAQLPNGPMLMLDEITKLEISGGSYGKGELHANLKIHPDHWFFPCHFQGDPVMPGCLGLDALWQLLGVFLACSGLAGRGRALGVGEVKFRGQIYPQAGSIEYQLDIKRVFKQPLPLGIADGLVKHQGKAIYIAKDLRVGLIKIKSLPE